MRNPSWNWSITPGHHSVHSSYSPYSEFSISDKVPLPSLTSLSQSNMDSPHKRLQHFYHKIYLVHCDIKRKPHHFRSIPVLASILYIVTRFPSILLPLAIWYVLVLTLLAMMAIPMCQVGHFLILPWYLPCWHEFSMHRQYHFRIWPLVNLYLGQELAESERSH